MSDSEKSVEDEYILEKYNSKLSSYKELAEIHRIAFNKRKEEEGGTMATDEEFLRMYFDAPTTEQDRFLIAIHKPTGKVVGFAGALPRTFYHDGNKYKYSIPSAISVLPEHQHKGIAKKLMTEGLKLAKEKGYDGGIGFFSPGNYSIDAVQAVSHQTGLFVQELMTIEKFFIRTFNINQFAKAKRTKWYERVGLSLIKRLKKVDNPSIRVAKPEDVDRIYELTLDFIEQNEFAFLREHNDLIWYFKQPQTYCVVHENENGIVDGFLLAWKVYMSGFGNAVPIGLIDIVHTYRLSLKDASDLCKFFCLESKKIGLCAVLGPYFPYFDLSPFKKAWFVTFRKKYIILLFHIKNHSLPQDVKKIFIDWR
jgi:GNAT superfamily N-acetyltransferase